MSNFDKAIKIILAEPPEMHYPAYYADLLSKAYYADLLREADVTSKNVGKCSEIPNSSETIYRQAAIDALGEGAMVNYQAAGHDNGLIKAIDVIKGLPSAKPETSILTVTVTPDLEEIERVARKIKDAPVMVLPSADPEKHTDKRTETHACDLISRQAAIDEIDEWIKAFRENGHKESAADARLIQDGIIQLPPAQPEIVRCGQCKYAEVADSEDGQDGYICQFHRGSIWFSGSYCSWAERRTNE